MLKVPTASAAPASEAVGSAGIHAKQRWLMNRGTGIAIAASLSLVSGMALAGCSRGAADEAGTAAAAEDLTTPATLPVVTVYRSPT